MPELANGVIFYLVFLLSTSLHEAAHAWVALKGGDRTAYEGGQVTIDPLPHIRREPFGMVVLPLISLLIAGWPLGFASAPYSRDWATRHPSRAAWMAFAGPAANFLLVALAAILINIGLFADVFVSPDSISFADVTEPAIEGHALWSPVAYFLGSFFAMNLLLGVFNLLPLPPLDGSGVIMLWMPARLVPKYQAFLWSMPYLSWIGILIAWRIFDDVFDLFFTMALNVLYLLTGDSYH